MESVFVDFETACNYIVEHFTAKISGIPDLAGILESGILAKIYWDSESRTGFLKILGPCRTPRCTHGAINVVSTLRKHTYKSVHSK